MVSPVAEEDAKGNTLPMRAFFKTTWWWVALNTFFLLCGIILFFWGLADRAGFTTVYWHSRYVFMMYWLFCFALPFIAVGMIVGVLGYRASTRATGASDDATVTPGDGPGGAAPVEASRSIETLIADATADAAGVTPAQREFSAKMLSGQGMGLTTEADLRKVWTKLDFARMLPGFPAMVEIHLRLWMEGRG